MSNTPRKHANYGDSKYIDKIWNLAKPIKNKDPEKYRQNPYGIEIYKSQSSNTTTTTTTNNNNNNNNNNSNIEVRSDNVIEHEHTEAKRNGKENVILQILLHRSKGKEILKKKKQNQKQLDFKIKNKVKIKL